MPARALKLLVLGYLVDQVVSPAAAGGLSSCGTTSGSSRRRHLSTRSLEPLLPGRATKNESKSKGRRRSPSRQPEPPITPRSYHLLGLDSALPQKAWHRPRLDSGGSGGPRSREPVRRVRPGERHSMLRRHGDRDPWLDLRTHLLPAARRVGAATSSVIGTRTAGSVAPASSTSAAQIEMWPASEGQFASCGCESGYGPAGMSGLLRLGSRRRFEPVRRIHPQRGCSP
jgi:hypothetical protein